MNDLPIPFTMLEYETWRRDEREPSPERPYISVNGMTMSPKVFEQWIGSLG